MKPYSHLIIASRLENDICPISPEEYYWGAVAPDIRFITGLRREQTHLPPKEIVGFLEKYPHLESFIQGYLVHCLTDNVDTRALLRQKVLLRPFLKHASIQFISTIIEVFHIKNNPVQKPVSGRINEMLRDLGIRTENLEAEVKRLKQYLEKPDFETNIAYVKSGTYPGLGLYVKEIESIQNNPLIIPIWASLVDLERLNQQIVLLIRDAEAFKQICG